MNKHVLVTLVQSCPSTSVWSCWVFSHSLMSHEWIWHHSDTSVSLNCHSICHQLDCTYIYQLGVTSFTLFQTYSADFTFYFVSWVFLIMLNPSNTLRAAQTILNHCTDTAIFWMAPSNDWAIVSNRSKGRFSCMDMLHTNQVCLSWTTVASIEWMTPCDLEQTGD